MFLVPVLPIAVALGGFIMLFNEQPPETDLAAVMEIAIEDVSTARLEAVIADARQDPAFTDELPGITLVLAERYFTNGSYDRAFELYAETLEYSETRPQQAAVSLSRIAWIAWLSTGDAEVALETIDRSLQIDPANAESTYIRGQILWCGLADREGAITQFQRVIAAGDLTDEVLDQVRGDLEAAQAGQSCR
jgi:tetratricopeptide (TPR) repeat protein